MPSRLVILSDLHLGRPGRGAIGPDAVRPLWQGADELVINGDLAELADPQVRGEAARQVLRLQELCDADGVRLCVLAGNHDPFITDRRYLRLCGGEVFVTHGDILHPAISPWTGHARRLAELHAGALAALTGGPCSGLDDRLAAAAHAAQAEWDERTNRPPHRTPGPVARRMQLAVKAAKVAWYWHTLPGRAADFAHWHVPECRYFVFGHIHRAGVWCRSGRVVINTGSYGLPGRPRGVVLEGRSMSVRRIVEADGRYRFADPPIAAYELAAAVQPRTVDAPVRLAA